MASKSHLAVAVLLMLSVGSVLSLRISPDERLRENAIEESLLVKHAGLEGVPIINPPTRVAGYFKLDRTKAAEMFYFYFQARQNPTRAPVVLWMTGGPGCSSELAVLYENGPYTLDKAGQNLLETKFGWDVTHNMIFVDQPIGTGFSYSDDEDDTVYNEAGVAEDMLDFLHNFFAAHPELAGLPLYITGESYAGHYVPAVSHRVWLSNKNKEGPYINFKGLAVGNGLTEPTIQFNAYGDFAVANNLISPLLRTWMSFLFPLCKLANDWCDSTNWYLVCSIGQQYCMATQFQPILAANPDINVYDITRKCEGRLCYGQSFFLARKVVAGHVLQVGVEHWASQKLTDRLAQVRDVAGTKAVSRNRNWDQLIGVIQVIGDNFTAADKFLNSPEVRRALGVGQRQWVSCAPDVYFNFAGDWLHRFDTVMPEMMADGIRIMIYAGDLDLICNYLGNRRWVDALDWQGSDAWQQTADVEWVVQGSPAGKVKEVGPLSFVQVYKAGHMVPMDQALNGLAMITAWTRNLSLIHSPHRVAAPMAASMQAKQDTATEKLVAIDAPADEDMTKPVSLMMARSTSKRSGASHFVKHMVARVAKAADVARTAMQQARITVRRLRAV